MSNARGIRAGRAYVELGTNDKALNAGLLKAQARLEAFGGHARKVGLALLGVGAGAIAGGFAAAKAFANAGDGLDEMSSRTSSTVEDLSRLLYVLKLNGGGAADLEAGIRKLDKTLVDAAGGGQEATEALAKLGLSADALKGLSRPEQFKKLADGFGGIADESERTATAMAVFGKSGTSLLPTLDLGAQGIDALIQKAERLGLVMSGEDAKKAAEFSDSLDTLNAAGASLVRTIGGALVPVFKSVAQWITAATAVARDYLAEHGPLIVAGLKFAAVVGAVGVGLYALGVAAKVAAIGVALVRGVIQAATTTFALGKAAIAALSNPLVLAATAAVALAGAIAVSTGVAGEAVNWLEEQFSDLTKSMDDAMKVYQDTLNMKPAAPDLSAISSATVQAQAKIGVQSQFGGVDAALKGVGRAQDKTAENTKKTADNTQRMLRVLQGGGVATTPTWG